MAKNYIKSIAVLVLICLISALALGGVYMLTAPIIADAEAGAVSAALKEVLPEASRFDPVELSAIKDCPPNVKEVYSAGESGCVVKIVTKGYSSGLTLLIGVNSMGKISGAKCLGSEETLGYEKTYGDTAKELSLDNIDSLATVSGATMTTGAYKAALKEALGVYALLGGGSFDSRSELEIALDSALPEAEGAFESVFITEYLEGAKCLYKATNGTGYVLNIADKYVGIGNDGKVKDTSLENVSAVEAFITAQQESEPAEINLSEYADIPAAVTAAYKTASGNYIFEAEGSGWGINGTYQTSGEAIKIKLCISADGKVIDCLTAYQSESKGVGDKCADENYYKLYVGKDNSAFSGDKVAMVDKGGVNSDLIISGATRTSEGYIWAVSDAYSAFNIVKGGS